MLFSQCTFQLKIRFVQSLGHRGFRSWPLTLAPHSPPAGAAAAAAACGRLLREASCVLTQREGETLCSFAKEQVRRNPRWEDLWTEPLGRRDRGLDCPAPGPVAAAHTPVLCSLLHVGAKGLVSSVSEVGPGWAGAPGGHRALRGRGCSLGCAVGGLPGPPGPEEANCHRHSLRKISVAMH